VPASLLVHPSQAALPSNPPTAGGDIPGSPRLVVALDHGAIPVVIATLLADFALPFQCLVPWGRMLVAIPEQTFLCDPPRALRDAVVSLSAGERAAIRKLLWHFRRDVGSTVSNPARVTSDAASRSLVQPPWCRVLPRCPWCLALPRCLVLPRYLVLPLTRPERSEDRDSPPRRSCGELATRGWRRMCCLRPCDSSRRRHRHRYGLKRRGGVTTRKAI